MDTACVRRSGCSSFCRCLSALLLKKSCVTFAFPVRWPSLFGRTCVEPEMGDLGKCIAGLLGVGFPERVHGDFNGKKGLLKGDQAASSGISGSSCVASAVDGFSMMKMAVFDPGPTWRVRTYRYLQHAEMTAFDSRGRMVIVSV